MNIGAIITTGLSPMSGNICHYGPFGRAWKTRTEWLVMLVNSDPFQVNNEAEAILFCALGVVDIKDM